MNAIKISNNICRTCLSTFPKSNLVSLQTIWFNASPLTYRDFLKNLFKENFSLDEKLPNQICLKCSKSLESTKKFLDLVKSSEKILETTQISVAACKEDTGKLNKKYHDDFIFKTPIKGKNKTINEIQFNGVTDDKNQSQIDTTINNGIILNCIQYYCQYCEFSTSYIESLSNHRKKEHNAVKRNNVSNGSSQDDQVIKNGFKCSDCYRVFHDEKARKIHYTLKHVLKTANKSLSNTFTFACDHCGKQFVNRVGLVTHQRFCKPFTPIECYICHANFTTMHTFEIHLKNAHDIECLHCCQYCGKNFGNSKRLALHQKRHNDRQYRCNSCHKSYINITELQTHQRNKHYANEAIII